MYEIARFDHRFERGLDKVTRNIQLARRRRHQRLLTRAITLTREMWQKTEGKAYFTWATQAEPRLRFLFRPLLWRGYNVIALDREYRHALVVVRSSRLPVEILSRTPTISDEMKPQMLAIATREGFEVNKTDLGETAWRLVSAQLSDQ